MKRSRAGILSICLCLAIISSFLLSSPFEVKAAGTEWAQVGPQVGTSAARVALAVRNGTPAVAYSATAGASSLFARQYSGTAWPAYGTIAGSPEMLYPSLQYDIHGTPYLSCFDANGGTTYVKRYDSVSGTWADVGVVGNINTDLQAQSVFKVYNNSLYVAYNSTGGRITVKKYNADTSSWDTLGTEFTDPNSRSLSMDVYNGVPYLCYSYATPTEYSTVKKYDAGTNSWVSVGDLSGELGYGFHSAEYNSLQVVGGVPYVAFYQVYKETSPAGISSGSIRLMKYGGAWTQASRLFLPDATGTVYELQLNISNGTPCLAYQYTATNSGNHVLKAFRQDGSSWSDLGLDGNLGTGASHADPYGSLSFDIDNGVPYIAYPDYTGGSPVPVVKKYLTLPGAPTNVTAAAGDGSATVSFTAPASDGGSPVTGYTVTANPGGITAQGTGSPITVTGLSNGTAYTFTITATTAQGTGDASPASGSVTPAAPVSSSQGSSSSQSSSSWQGSSSSQSSTSSTSDTYRNPKTGEAEALPIAFAVLTGSCLMGAAVVFGRRRETHKQ